MMLLWPLMKGSTGHARERHSPLQLGCHCTSGGRLVPGLVGAPGLNIKARQEIWAIGLTSRGKRSRERDAMAKANVPKSHTHIRFSVRCGRCEIG